MYVLVNDLLSKSQRIPQSSHAVAEYVFAYYDEIKEWVKDHRTIVVLECHANRMGILSSKLKSKQFVDDDLDDMLTAVAFEPMTKEEGDKYFKTLKLA
jgi:hypothetical protein